MKKIAIALVAAFALSSTAFASEEIKLAAAIGSGASAGSGAGASAGAATGTAAGAAAGAATANMIAVGVIAASSLAVAADAGGTTSH